MPVENTPGPAIIDKQPECPTARKERANPIRQKADESHTSLAMSSDTLVFIHSTKSWEGLYVLGTVTGVKDTKITVYRERQRHKLTITICTYWRTESGTELKLGGDWKKHLRGEDDRTVL